MGDAPAGLPFKARLRLAARKLRALAAADLSVWSYKVLIATPSGVIVSDENEAWIDD